jgi:putative transposase
MGIDITAARPGNPHGKGWVERFFRTVRDEHDKLFAGGEFYCGDDMAPEINRRLSVEVKAGRRKLPSVWDYTQSLMAFFERVSHRPMDVLNGKTPAEVWAESFVRIPTVYPVAELIRPMETAMVRRQMVTLHKRTYYLQALIDWQGKRVRVRYDLHHDSHVWLYDDRDQLIGQAELTYKVAAIPDSRIVEARMRASDKAVQRKEQDIAEILRRSADPIDAQSQVLAIEALAPTVLPALPQAAPLSTPAADNGPDIDITDWRPQA